VFILNRYLPIEYKRINLSVLCVSVVKRILKKNEALRIKRRVIINTWLNELLEKPLPSWF